MRNQLSCLPFEDKSIKLQRYMAYIAIEILIKIAVMCSCFLYVSIRKCVRNRFKFRISTVKELQNKKSIAKSIKDEVDFLQGNNFILQIFNAIWAPFFLFLTFMTFDMSEQLWQNRLIRDITILFMTMQFISGSVILFANFIKGERNRCCIGFLQRLALLLVIFLVPLISLATLIVCR